MYPCRHAARKPWPCRIAGAALLLAMLPGLAPIDPLAGDLDNLGPVLTLNLRTAFATKMDWQVLALQAPGEENRFGNIPARICFRAAATAPLAGCTALTHTAVNDNDRLVYQTVIGLSITRLLQQPAVPAVMAQAEMSYGGSGTSTQYALWTFHPRADRFDRLATFEISEQGELQIIDTGKLAGSIITADYIWGDGESHFARHRFAITVHHLDPVTLTYTDILRYVTAGKYPSLDEGGVDVVRPETPQILRTLHFIYPKVF
jgi:hypothetical protein